ncbi:MAG TPA: methyltransferase domain-containing protein [Thermoanaerobaculia bacterium]|nr:methyltransferase domain-containing protein [Thermoanaerobaculia bacterium]
MSSTSLRTSIELALDPAAAFAVFAEELASGLARLGLHFDAGAQGRVTEGAVEVGQVIAWEPGTSMALEWHPADWQPEEVTRVELHFEPADGGTRVTLEHRGWGGLIGDGGELMGWFAGEVVAPLWRATAPARFGDWLTDRGARRPSGAQARGIYGDPVYHYPNFRVILAELALGAEDYLLEVGCGGGALLKEALRSGCRAAAVDHSPDMVRLAREANREAVAAGRLEIFEASAQRLPFPDDAFTCGAMTAVLGFLPDPVAALAEIRRVLRTGGRLVVLGSDPEVRGTMAAPEPMASRLRFYDGDELERLGREAGFGTVSVVRRSLEAFAREVGVPEEHVPLFAGAGPRFLLARKS